MALPIAPTPVLTGKSAIAFARYMRDSEKVSDKLFVRKVDVAEIDRLIKDRAKKRRGVPVK